MKRTVLALLAGVVFVLTLSPSAQADSFLSVTVAVSGGGTSSMTFSSGGNGVSAPTNFTLNGVTFNTLSLTSNSPGNAAGSFTTDTKFGVTNNNTANATISVGFAENNFTLPAGSPLTLNDTHSVDNVLINPSITEVFKGWGDATNSLVPTTGTLVQPADCTTGGAGTSCKQDAVGSFTRSGAFGLNGTESFTLAAGGVGDAQASINVSAVPEPSSVFLLGTGMLILAGRKLRKK